MTRVPLFVLCTAMAVSYLGLQARASIAAQASSAQTKAADKTSERLDALEARVKEFEDKVDRATLKNDYTQQVQKQYEAYYEKAFSTQLQIFTILGITLSVVFFLAGRFGLGIFDRRIQLELKSATDGLKLDFEKRLGEQLSSLSEMNTARVEEVENALRSKITLLEGDLQLRSDYQFELSMGTAAWMEKDYNAAVGRSRAAIALYKKGKERGLIPASAAITTLGLLFWSIQKQDETKFIEGGKKEMEDPLYQGLADELAQVAEEWPDWQPIFEK